MFLSGYILVYSRVAVRGDGPIRLYISILKNSRVRLHISILKNSRVRGDGIIHERRAFVKCQNDVKIADKSLMVHF